MTSPTLRKDMKVTVPEPQWVQITMRAWDAEDMAHSLQWLSRILKQTGRLNSNDDLIEMYTFMADKILHDGLLD